MKLKVKLNGQEIDCVIGHSLLTAAHEVIKKEKHANFRSTIDAIAGAGSGMDSKESLLLVLEEHIRGQVPTEMEVKGWLTTPEGRKFSLIHGTRSYPVKLTAETADLVLDEMSEEESDAFLDAIMGICYGSQQASVSRQIVEKAVERSRMELEAAEIEIQRYRQQLDTEKAKPVQS